MTPTFDSPGVTATLWFDLRQARAELLDARQVLRGKDTPAHRRAVEDRWARIDRLLDRLIAARRSADTASSRSFESSPQDPRTPGIRPSVSAQPVSSEHDW